MLIHQCQAVKGNIVNIMASNVYGGYIHIFDFTECFITLIKTAKIPEIYSLFCALSNLLLLCSYKTLHKCIQQNPNIFYKQSKVNYARCLVINIYIKSIKSKILYSYRFIE